MLGEVVGRQLGEREWEAEGGEGGHRLASGSCPHHSPQHEGRWRMGNWATSGRRTVRAQAQVRPVPQQEARGLRRVVWGRTRLQERFTPGARAQASTVMDCRVAPVPLPRLPVRTTCCLIPQQLQAALPPDRGSQELLLNQAKNLAFSEGRDEGPEQNTFLQP